MRCTLVGAIGFMGLVPTQAGAVGDGANGLQTTAAAGLSIALHAKPLVREQAMLSITAGGMDRTLELPNSA